MIPRRRIYNYVYADIHCMLHMCAHIYSKHKNHPMKTQLTATGLNERIRQSIKRHVNASFDSKGME